MHDFVFAILYSYPPNFSSFKLETSLAACMQIVFSWGGGFGGGADGDDGYVNIYIYVVESLRSPSESIATLLTGCHTPAQNKKFKKKKADELKNQEKLMFQSEFKIQPCPSSAVDRRTHYDSSFLFYSSLQLIG